VAISNLQEAGRTSEDVLRSDLFYRLAALRITVPSSTQSRAGAGAAGTDND